MYKFFGQPLREITSKKTGKIMFRFDTKGEFITDDTEIIERALGFFDYIKLEAKPDGERVSKTHFVPVMTIVVAGEEVQPEDKSEDTPEIKVEEVLRKCKKCEFTCVNYGELMTHYKNIHPKEVK